MNKAALLRPVNLLLALSFVIQALTSVMIFFHIKTPYAGAIFETHEYNGVIFIVLIIVHLILNWGWVAANVLKPKK